MNHLGQFIKHGNSLVFKAEDLSGFHLQPVEGAQEEVPEAPMAAEIVVEEPNLEEELVQEEPVEEAVPEVEAPIIEETIQAEEQEAFVEPEVKSSNKTAWYMVAAIVALAIIVSLFYLNRAEQTTAEVPSTDTLANAPVTDIDTAVNPSLDTLNQVADTTVVDTTQRAVPTDNKPLIPANHNYQVVIGSHRTLAQAYEQAESFNKAGITSVRVIPSKLAKNLKKVIWDSYETKEQADSALRYVQKRYVSDAWSGPINK